MLTGEAVEWLSWGHTEETEAECESKFMLLITATHLTASSQLNDPLQSLGILVSGDLSRKVKNPWSTGPKLTEKTFIQLCPPKPKSHIEWAYSRDNGTHARGHLIQISLGSTTVGHRSSHVGQCKGPRDTRWTNSEN